jgi:histidinol-phosphatase (PHP family)
MTAENWKVSLHGGHSGDFCLHGDDTLEEMLEAAVEFGYATFGVTAHSPRTDAKFLYPEEIEASYSPADLDRDFTNYVSTCRELATKFEDRLEVLVGAEIEIVPELGYVEEVTSLRRRHKLDYIVGSVHWVDELPIDVTRELFDEAVENRDGLEPFLVRYFNLVEQMVSDLRPEVVGHIDRPRLYTGDAPEFDSVPVLDAIDAALEACLKADSILDLNVSAIRKELEHPYPAPKILEKAKELGIPFCFGDDSHRTSAVGENIAVGRRYLLDHGITSITKLTKLDGSTAKQQMFL